MTFPTLTAESLRARARAALIHLGLSVLVASAVAAVVFALWYPPPFREISGGRELFLIVVAVDVVMGPLITFFVFDRRKPRRELARDLAIVGTLQICALAYGLQSVAQARPAVIALEGQRLRVVRAIDIADEDMTRAPQGLARLRWTGPQWVATRAPGASEKLDAIERGIAGQDIGMRPEFWLPPEQTSAAYASAAMPIAKLRELNIKHATALDIALKEIPVAQNGVAIGFLPILARRTDWSALVDLRDGHILGYIPFEGF